ncbi:MAG: hypothetical protein AAFR58_07465 [Cyanobacteria bacterium J06627_28]
MKFNKLAKEQGFSVGALADKVADILPNANGGTDVTEAQQAQILALLQAPEPNNLTALNADGTDPILGVLTERIEQEQALETPEQMVDAMIERYLSNPDDLPTDAEYRAAIITYVDLVKKRHARRQTQSAKLRSLLRRSDAEPLAAEPLALEHFYSSGQNTTDTGSKLTSAIQPPKLSAANT